MDLRPEIVQDGLSEVELPSTLLDLKNPTEEYVTNLATQFLNKCDIDTATIIKPTLDQASSLSLVEYNPEIIPFVNLLGVMAGICSEIFLKDLFLTDLTNPAPKKTRRFAKILSNFLLYAYTKKAFIEETLVEIRLKPQRLDNINRQINECVEMKNKKALENAKKLELKEQFTAEITRLQSLQAARKAKIAEVQETLKAVEKKKLDVVQDHGKLSSEAVRVYKMTEELEAKLVRAPEQCEARLKELLEEKQRQMEERSAIEAAMQSKKPAIEKLQSHLSIVSNRHRRFAEITDAYQRLQNSKKVLEETKKQVAQKKALIEDEKVPSGKENSKATDAILQKTRDECDQHLASIRADLVELLNVKKNLECKLADFETRQQAAFLEKEEISATIAKVVKECEQLVAYGQDVYDNEINLERKRKVTLETVNQ